MPHFIKNRPDILIILLYIVLPFMVFPEIVFGGKTLYWSDLSWMHYPRHIFAAEEWLAGRVPLWDPYQHNGLPFLAETQVGALYPLSAIFLSPLSPSLELSLYILLHFTLGASFTFLLSRSLKLALLPAAVAGLSFGFGGFLMAQVTNLNIMTGAVWLPLILWGLIRANRRRSWRVALLASIPLALQIFTAQPQVVFYTVATLLGYGLYQIAANLFTGHRGRRTAVKTALLVGTTILAGLLLAAPQWLSTLELQRLSVRSGERGLEFLTQNSLPPAMWLNLLLPSAFGNNVTGFRGGDPFQEDFIYIGLIPLFLIFLSLSQRHKRDMPFFLLLLLGSVLLASGRYTPLYEIVVQYLPGFSLFRIPARWLMVVNLALAVLAGYGLQGVLDRNVSAATILWGGLAVSLLLLAALAAAWLFPDALVNWSRPLLGDANHKLLTVVLDKAFVIDPAYHDRLLLGRLPWLAMPAGLLVTNVAIAMLLVGLLVSQKIRSTAFAALLLAAIAVDLAAAGGTTVNPLKPADWWQQLSGGAQYVLANIRDSERVFPLGMGSEEATVSHLGQYFPSVYRVRSAGGHGSSLMLARTGQFLKDAHPVQAIQVLGVRYILTLGQMGPDAAATYPLAYNQPDGFVYENPAPLPRTSVVHRLVQAATPDEALAYLQGTDIDPARTVIIESQDETLPQPAQPAQGDSSSAEIIAETPQRINIAVDAAAGGYLVLLDTFYPGWTASLDGEPAKIHRANYVARAVFVPKGEHTLLFEYRPWPFRLGLWLSGATLLVIGAGLVLSRRRNNGEIVEIG